jgi:hypothetical protein
VKLRSCPEVDASEGSAAGRVVWMSVLWALVHSLLASKQAKDLARRVAGALLLLSYYLPAAAWALVQRRPRHLIYSAPLAVASWVALKGRSSTS